MSNALGIKGIMGAGKQSAYLTVVDATDKIPFLSESLDEAAEYALHEYLHGNAGVLDSDRIFVPVGGSVEAILCYAQKTGSAFVDSSILIAAAMGACTYASSYNRITFQDALAQVLSIAVDKGANAADVWEIICAMVSNFSISGSSGETVKLAAEIQANALAISSTENTVTELAALPTDLIRQILFSDITFRIGDQAGDLDADDKIGISAFTLDVNNSLSDPEQVSPDATKILNYAHTDAKVPIQPVRNGFREVVLSLTLPRYGQDSDLFLNWKTNQTRLQAKIEFTDGSDEFNILLPHIKVETAGAPVAGAEAVPQNITIRAFRRNTASDITFTDTTTDDGELWFETKDERDASILA